MILIIDGNNLFYKSYYTNSSQKNDYLIDDVRSAPIRIFLMSVYEIVERFKPSKIFVAWDKRSGKNYRKDIDGTYKRNRKTDADKMDEITNCMDVCMEFCGILGISNVYPHRLEADDIIYFLVNNFPNDRVTIVSSDKDMLQLVEPDRVMIYDPVKHLVMDYSITVESLGMTPKQFILYKAISGDPSDNITGIEKYGDVRTRRVIREKSIQTTFDELQQATIRHNINLIDLSRTFRNCPDEHDQYRAQLTNTSFNRDEFDRMCSKWKFDFFAESWDQLFNHENNLEYILSSN